MRTLLLVLLFTSLLCENARSQRRIGVVDSETINNQLAQAIGLDSLVAISRDTIERLRTAWTKSFSKKYSDIQSRFCGTPEEFKRITSKLQAEMDDIGSLDTLAKDSLMIWRRECLARIDLIIREKTTAFAKKKKLRLVVDQKQVLYFKSRMDFTQTVAEKVLQESSDLLALSKAYHDKVLAALGRCLRPDAYWKGW